VKLWPSGSRFAAVGLVLFVLGFLVPSSARAASPYASYEAAMAQCTASFSVVSSSVADGYLTLGSCQAFTGYVGVTATPTSLGASVGFQPYTCSSEGACWEAWEFTGAVGGVCTADYVLPVGTKFQASATNGAAGYQGCELAMVIGGPDSGQMEEDGNQLGTSPTQTATAAPPNVSCSADGSCTYCATGTAICVTANAPTPPASASTSSAATTASITNNPASSSSSSSTTTTTGSTSGSGTGTGSSGSGSGSFSSTSTTTGSTSSPASASSTTCTTGVCDVGNADGSIASLYTASTDTPGSVYATFVSQVSNTPVMSAATGFFTLNVAGTCPTWTIPGNKYWGAAGFSFDFFCSSAMLEIFQLAGYLVLAVAAYAAFKIALY